MKNFAIALALMLSITSLQARAASPCKKRTIEQLVNEFATAYDAKTLGSLDAAHPLLGSVRISIEDSLGDNDFTIKRVKTLAQADRWLRSREREEGAPFRETRPLVRCRKGLCTYNFDGGILHNHLYLQKISYGYRNGCPYIKTIYLLDGD